MNANPASQSHSQSPPPPSSSDEDRETMLILTPASTSVSDEGGGVHERRDRDRDRNREGLEDHDDELQIVGTSSNNHNNDSNADHDNENDDNDRDELLQSEGGIIGGGRCVSSIGSVSGGDLGDEDGGNHHRLHHNSNNNGNECGSGDGSVSTPIANAPSTSTIRESNTKFDVWSTSAAYGRRRLLSQVGSLSKEITELRSMIARSTSASNSISEEQAEDLSRVKANHRSSLASLAESHRSEMSSLASAHQEELKRLEKIHVEDMRNARRGFGFSNDLVQGLHQSYAKQIESLVLDLGEARRQLKDVEALASHPRAATPPATPADNMPEPSSRILDMAIRFNDLSDAFSVAELSIPHPGRTYKAVSEHINHAAKNYLQALNTAAEFFTEGSKSGEARRIRNWYQAASGNRLNMRFLHGMEGDSMKDMWETELWRNDNFTLRVVCEAEMWDSVPVFNDDEEFVEQQHRHQPLKATSTGTRTTRSTREPLGPASEEQLVQVDTPSTVDAFNPTVVLDRINRALGGLDINEDLHSAEEDDENKENIQRPMPKRHVMVEDVTDEEDHYKDDPEDEGVGLAISSSPVPATPLEKEPLLPGNSARRVPANNKPLSDDSYLEKLLGTEEEREREREEVKGTGGSSDSNSWSFDDLFSPLPADKGKGKEKIAGLFEDRAQDPENPMDHLTGGKPGWKWMLSDGIVKSPSSVLQHPPPDTHALRMAQQYFRDSLRKPWLENLREEEEDEKIESDCDQPVFSEGGDPIPDKKGGPFFTFGEEVASSPAPPPAPPAPEQPRKMSGLPPYLRTDVESSVEGARLDDDSDIDDNQPRDGVDVENPFADLKPGMCDTPVMGTARSAASTTPLLRDGSPAPRQNRGGPSLKIQTDTQRPLRTLGDPFVPLPKPPPKCNLPHHKPPGQQRYRPNNSYQFQTVGRDDDETTARYEDTASEISDTTADDDAAWERKFSRPRGKVADPYWHEKSPGGAESFRSRSRSPPPHPALSRPSTTTTDNLDYVLPPQVYQQPVGLPSSSGGGNVGPIRYGSVSGVRSMGPLGPGSHSMAAAGYVNSQHIQQQAQAQAQAQAQKAQQVQQAQQQAQQAQAHADLFQQQIEYNKLINAGYLPRPISSGPSSFLGGGPVYAPNPPLNSAATFTGGVPVRPAYMTMGNAEQRLASEGGGAWPMRPMLMQPHMNPQTAHLWASNGEGRRSYSTDSTGPLLGLRNPETLGLLQQHQQQLAAQHAQAQVQAQAQQQQQAQQAQVQAQQQLSSSLLSSQQGTRPPSTMSMSLEQATYGSAAGLGAAPWAAALASAYGQPGTPASAHTLTPTWFALQQAHGGPQNAGTPAAFDSMWTGTPITGMPAHWGC